MHKTRAKVFWTGRSQAIRIPKQFRVQGNEVTIRRMGNTLVIEPLDEWPEGYVESFRGLAEDLERFPQGDAEEREPLP